MYFEINFPVSANAYQKAYDEGYCDNNRSYKLRRNLNKIILIIIIILLKSGKIIFVLQLFLLVFL